MNRYLRTAAAFMLTALSFTLINSCQQFHSTTEEKNESLILNASPSQMLTVSFKGVDIITGGRISFYARNWRLLKDINVQDMAESCHNGMSALYKKDNIPSVASYEITIKCINNKLLIDFNYHAVADSKLTYACLDLFINEDLFETAEPSGQLGPVTQLPLTTSIGTAAWRFSSKQKIMPGWIYRSTNQSWRPDNLRFRSFLYTGEKQPGHSIHDNVIAEMELTPNSRADSVAEARRLFKTLNTLPKLSPALKRHLLEDPEAAAVKSKLSSVFSGQITQNIKEINDKAKSLINRLLNKYSPHATPNKQAPLIIPQPQKISYATGSFKINQSTVIQVPANATPRETYGVKILQDELKQYYGLTVPIEKSALPSLSKSTIYIGTAAKSKLIQQRCQALNLEIPQKAEGYALKIEPQQIIIAGVDAPGTFYGVQTLISLIRKQHSTVNVPCVTISDWPTMKLRGIMLSPGYCSTDVFKRVVRRVLARHKMNTLVIGVGNVGHIKWKSHPELAVPGLSWTTEQLKECVDYAKKHFLEVIPEIEWIGHQGEIRKKHPELAENRTSGNAICMSNPAAKKLLTDIFTEAIDIFNPKYVHIGAHEAWPVGKCKHCSRTPADQLFAKHISWIHNWLAKRNIKTIMYSDLLLDNAVWQGRAPANSNKPNSPYSAILHPAIDKISKEIIIAVWVYEGCSDYTALSYFKDKGFPTIAYTWYKPENNYDFAQQAVKDGALGMIGTSWSFFSAGHGVTDYNLNMMSLLAAEYCWSPDKPQLSHLPYFPVKQLQKSLSTPRPSSAATTLSPVAISSWCNASLIDEKAADGKGWLDKGPFYDLRNLPTGNQTLGTVPFYIIPSSQHNPFQCIAVANSNSLNYPPQVTGIEINRKARSLVFLNAVTHTGYGKGIAEYTIHYKNHTQPAVLKLVEMNNCTPVFHPEYYVSKFSSLWYLNNYIPNSSKVWSGYSDAGLEASLQAIEWVNPHPDQEISTIDMKIISGSKKSTVFLLGITAVN